MCVISVVCICGISAVYVWYMCDMYLWYICGISAVYVRYMCGIFAFKLDVVVDRLEMCHL